MRVYDDWFGPPRGEVAARPGARMAYGSSEYGYPSELATGDGRGLGYARDDYGYRRHDDRPAAARYRPPWHARLPGRPARGFPVRGVHSYDLDYGRQAGGPTTEYSGRVGYSEIPGTLTPRGRYAFYYETRCETPYHRPRYEDWYHRPRYEDWHWSAAEPAWRRHRGSPGDARGYRPRPVAVERGERPSRRDPPRGYRPRPSAWRT